MAGGQISGGDLPEGRTCHDGEVYGERGEVAELEASLVTRGCPTARHGCPAATRPYGGRASPQSIGGSQGARLGRCFPVRPPNQGTRIFPRTKPPVPLKAVRERRVTRSR